MFKRTKNTNTDVPMATKPTKSSKNAPIGQIGHSSLAYSSTIVGNVHSQGELRVDGKLIGNLICESKLVIGDKGNIEGNIDTKTAIIAGKVAGKIVVRETLQLTETAVIEGEIFANKMIVQVGAKFTGNCNMSEKAHEMIKTEAKFEDISELFEKGTKLLNKEK